MNKALKNFFQLESASGILLILSALLAIGLANSPLASVYLGLQQPLLLWVNDGLMAIFFLLVALEIKREILEGALSSREQAMFPLVAALGGMLAPALLYWLINADNPQAAAGWAIPAATDIAFALGILALLGNRVPPALKIFLLALAVIDDLGVILIIALFYTADLNLLALLMAVVATLLLFWMNRRGVMRLPAYLLVGLVLWVAVLKSGVHATLAGVILGFMIPHHRAQRDSPLQRVEHGLHPWSAFGILPLFAFFNAGIPLSGIGIDTLWAPVPLGVMLGLFLGKPLGITLISWLALRLKLVKLPDGIHFVDILAVSLLCGIGFTMSMFIASLAFPGSELANLSRLGIVTGSTLAAICGYVVLRMRLAVPRLVGRHDKWQPCGNQP
jgi:NhaA family Na+:H+ antiporter